MAKDIHIINILTYKLPFKLASQIYNEYQSRLIESCFLIDKYKKYQPLKEDIKTVEVILSLSIFHRRVIANFDGAVKFYGTVSQKGETETVRIGNYSLTCDEKNRILAVVMNYYSLLEKFSIPRVVMEYYETREFLIKLINLKSELKNADSEKRPTRNKRNQIDEEDLPF